MRIIQCVIRFSILFCLVGLFSACYSPGRSIVKSYKSLSTEERSLADTFLLRALDREALYSIMSPIKPMSSVHFFKFIPDSLIAGKYERELILYQRFTQLFTNRNIQFVYNPFARMDSANRNAEIYVFNKKRWKELMTQHQSFFSMWGFNEHIDPATVLAVTEYEKSYNRWRSYGYLFGYPSHAVDFFVEAGKQQDSTGKFVTRDFFHIPVYIRTSGHFTYAIPKGYQPSVEDSSLYKKSYEVLQRYKSLRNKYSTKTGVKAVKLFARHANF